MKCNYANEKDLEDMKILLDYLFHNKHFLQASKSNSWSSWYVGDDAEFGEFKFKTNNVEVIVLYQGKCGQARCHPNDKFDLQKGIDIALLRAHIQFLQKQLAEKIL